MSNIVLQRDVSDLGLLKYLSAASAATGGGGGNSATTTGVTVDRQSGKSMPNALALAIVYDGTLATGKALQFGYAVQDSPDGTNWSDYQTATYASVATGATAASVVSGQLQVAVNLTSARRYVRANYATNLTATQTDTAVARAVGFFGGYDRYAEP